MLQNAPRPDWKIYVSEKSIEPNEINSQHVFTNLHKFRVEPKGNGIVKRSDDNTQFPYDTLYFNFLSLKGCSIKVTARFPKGKLNYL